MNAEDKEWLVGIRGAIETSRLNILEFINKHGATAGLSVALQAVETARLEVDYLLETGDFTSSEGQS